MTTEAALTHHLAVAQSDVAAALVAARPLVDRPRNEALAGRLAAKVRQSPPPGTKEYVP